MKTNYLTALVLITLFTGCSSTYRVSDFASIAHFNDDFNNSVAEKSTKIVTLNNDSSFTCNKHIFADGNNLNLFDIKYDSIKAKYAVSEIKNIEFTDISKSSAIVTLNNGNKLNTTDIIAGPDTVYFEDIVIEKINLTVIPISEVRKIEFKNRWKGFLFGAITFAVPGAFIGIAMNGSEQTNMNNPPAYQISIPLISGLVGGIIGAITGWNYIYQFNK